MFAFLLIWLVASRAAQQLPVPELRILPEAELPEVVREIMDVRLATEQGEVKIFRGNLREKASTAYEKLKQAFSGRTVPLTAGRRWLGFLSFVILAMILVPL